MGSLEASEENSVDRDFFEGEETRDVGVMGGLFLIVFIEYFH